MIDTVVFGSQAFRPGFVSNVSVCIVELDEGFPPWQRFDTKSGTLRRKQDSQLTAQLTTPRYLIVGLNSWQIRMQNIGCTARVD
jgi:hypothetical protein